MEPRLLPIDDGNLGRLGVPAGLNGMQIQAAQSGLELGGQNLSGNIDPTLGQVASILQNTGGILGTLNNVGSAINTYQYSQQSQQDYNNLMDKVGGVQNASNNFNNANNNFLGAGIELSSLLSVAQGYQDRIGELKGQTDANAARLSQIQSQSTQLMNQFRNTRDPATRTQISNQLKALQGETLQLQSNTNMAKAEAGALGTALTNMQGDISTLTNQVGSAREQLLVERENLLRQYGEANQAKETLVNNYESFMGRAEAFGFSGMSIDAMKTFSNGLYDFSQGAYGSAGAQFGSMAFDFTDLFAPSLVPGSDLIKAGIAGIGAGADMGSFEAGFDKFLNSVGFGSALDGSVRAWNQLSGSSDPITQMQASWGLLGNTTDMIGTGAAMGLGFTGSGALGAPLVNFGTNAMSDAAFWMGAMTGNVLSTDISPAVGASVEFMNFLNVLDVTDNNQIVNGVSSLISSIENLFNGTLGDAGNLSARQKMEETYNQWNQSWGGGQLSFGASAWQNGLNGMWSVQNVPVQSGQPFSMDATKAFDGPTSGLESLPWSESPNNPYNPINGDQTFTPDFTKMWDPKDPFNLDPRKRQSPSDPSSDPTDPEDKPEPPDDDPDCPKKPNPPKPSPAPPPQSSGQATGTLPIGPDGIPEFNFELPKLP